jgi:hypothetical protein
MKKVFGIENFEQEFKEWADFKREQIEFASALKVEGGSLPGSQPPAGPGPAGGPAGTGGRPPSGQKPPAARTKGSAEGPRATIVQS